MWKSAPIPNDAIALRRDLPAAFKRRLTAALRAISFKDLPSGVVHVFPAKDTTNFVSTPDAAYDGICDLVKTLHVDLKKLS